MLSSKIKSIQSQNTYKLTEKNRKLNKFLFIHLLNNNKENVSQLKSIIYETTKTSAYNSKSRLTRRCIISNRGRGILRAFGVSRIHLREMMSFGVIPGYSKAVW